MHRRVRLRQRALVPFLAQCAGASIPSMGAAAGAYCASGGSACVQDPRFSPPIGGSCVPDDICDDVSAVGLHCYWFDATEYGRSPPPATTCPPTDEGTPLCGGACGDCSAPGRAERDLHCIGRNDDRDLGICTLFRGACSPDVPASPREMPPDPGYPGWTYASTVCLVLRSESGELEPSGYPVPDTGCRTYRAEFPEAVECMDDAWAPLL